MIYEINIKFWLVYLDIFKILPKKFIYIVENDFNSPQRRIHKL